MLDELRRLLSKRDEFCVPMEHLNNTELIKARVKRAPTKSQSALRHVLSYLYLDDGPINLTNVQYREAKPYLACYEILLSCYLKSRTNGSERREYGKPALRQMRKVGYRCECCGLQDVRVLTLDHVHGKSKSVFLVLCSNCHYIKSRKYDWLGKKRSDYGLLTTDY